MPKPKEPKLEITGTVEQYCKVPVGVLKQTLDYLLDHGTPRHVYPMIGPLANALQNPVTVESLIDGPKE